MQNGGIISETCKQESMQNRGEDRGEALLTRENAGSSLKIEAPKSFMLDYTPKSFGGQNSLGMLCLLPYIQQYGIDRLIQNSDYPESSAISRLSSILCFIALKLSNVRRYSADDIWCMDRGSGLFASLNVLPKTGWYTSYSHRVTRSMEKFKNT